MRIKIFCVIDFNSECKWKHINSQDENRKGRTKGNFRVTEDFVF